MINFCSMAQIVFNQGFEQVAVAPVRQLVEIDPITQEASLNFHDGQSAAWESAARFVLMLSGTQGGKTSFGPWWLWNELLKQGAGDYIAATTSYDMFKLKMLPELIKCFRDILGIGRYWPGLRVIEIRDPATGKFLASNAHDPMYARIVLRSAEAPDGFESTTAKAAWLDEVGQDGWDVTIWEAVLRRLSLAAKDGGGRVLGTTTIYNSGWTKTEWYDRAIAGDPLYAVISFPSTMNEQFPPEEYARAKATMPAWRFKMFYKGQYSNPPGLIYGEAWSDENDDELSFEFEPGMFPTGWPHWVMLDFGGANTATLYAVEDVTQTPSVFYVYEEHLEGHKSTPDHVEDLKKRLGPHRLVGLRAVGGSKSESQHRMDWGAAGLKVIEPRISDVEVGISAGIELIKSGRVKFAKHLAGLRHEKATYKRVIEDDGTVTERIDDKARFHRLDAFRYFAVYIRNPTLKRLSARGGSGKKRATRRSYNRARRR